MQPTDQEITDYLVSKGCPEKHLKEAVEIVKMRMAIRQVELKEAVEYVMKWIKRAEKP